MRLDVSGTLNGAQTGTTVQDLKINATGIGAMRLQIGANEHQVLEVNIPAVSLQNMGIENVDVSTAEGADDAIDRVAAPSNMYLPFEADWVHSRTVWNLRSTVWILPAKI